MATLAGAAFAQDGQPWRDASLPPERRAQLLVEAMTLDQKLALINGEESQPVPQMGVPANRAIDGCCGVVTGARPTTALPAGLSLASTFDERRATTYGRAAGAEAWLLGFNGLGGPTMDLNRSPFHGRQYESFGEDPLLAGRVGAAQTRGEQRNAITALVKHYVLNDQESRRVSVDERVDQRTLNELWIRPWEILVGKADPGSIMCAFPKVNGEHACDNRHLLQDILRGRLGFKGFVSSDYAACYAGYGSFLAGTDLCGPGEEFSVPALRAAVQSGALPPERLNEIVRRVLRTFFARGIYDRPAPGTLQPSATEPSPVPEGTSGAPQDPEPGTSPLPDSVLDRHEQIARRVAREGSVLLKNDREGLPLAARRTRSIAVIGSDADWYIAGSNGSPPRPARLTTILDGIGARAGSGVEVTHVKGTDPVRLGDSLPGLEPVPSAVLAPPGGASGHGLVGQYFQNPVFQGDPFASRIDDQVNVREGISSAILNNTQVPGLPLPLLFNPDSSMRWFGSLTAPVTGDYTLGLSLLGSATLFVDGDAMITADQDTFGSVTKTLRLVAGEAHEIRIDYRPDAPNQFAGSLAEAALPMIRFGWIPPSSAAVPGVQAAAAAAKRADVAIVVARDYAGEEADRGTLTLPQGQDRLIRAVAKANPHTVVVLATDGPVLMPWLRDVDAVLEAWYGGEAQGKAVADLLFGDHSPSGKLPITFPATERQPEQIGIQNPFRQVNELNPVAAHDEGVFTGYRGYERRNVRPLFPFGHGLSYTRFQYGRVQVRGPRPNGRSGRVRVLVRNTGRRAATETVEVYSGRLPTAAVDTPPKLLIGWARVTLGPGRQRNVTVPIDIRGPQHALSYFDAGSNSWVTPRGNVRIYIGGSSRDIRRTGTMTVR